MPSLPSAAASSLVEGDDSLQYGIQVHSGLPLGGLARTHSIPPCGSLGPEKVDPLNNLVQDTVPLLLRVQTMCPVASNSSIRVTNTCRLCPSVSGSCRSKSH